MGLLDWFFKVDRATPLSPLVAAALDTAHAQEDARVAAIAAAWAAYRGVFPDPLTTDPGEPDDNVKVNHLGPVVDAGVAYLFSPPPELHVRDGFTKDPD